MSLKKQALLGIVWTFSQQFGTQIINFGISIILARILLPSDFGAIAMFSVVMAIASTLADGGMASSLIRTIRVNDKDFSTVFWFNIVVAILIYVLLYIIAPLIAIFYNLKVLTSIIRVYCLILIINSTVTVQSVRFIKNMDFKTSFKIQLPSLIIGGVSGVLFAYYDYGVWSLVYYALIQNFFSSIQYWLYSDWKPSFIFDRKKFKQHFGFGYKLTLSDLLNTIFNNINTIIIGKMFSSVTLGYYNRADMLKQLPVSNLSNALNKVTFPLFSKLKDDNLKLKEVYQKLMKLVVFIITPILCFMMIVAEPLIRFLLTEKWLPIVPYFQVLAISGILYPIHSYNLNILKVKGRSDLFFKLEVIKKVFAVLTLVVSIKFGIMGIIWGQVIISLFAFFINTYFTGKILDYGSFSQIIDLLPTIIVSGIISFFLYYLNNHVGYKISDFIRIILIFLAFITIYLLTTWFLKFKEIDYVKELLKK